MSFKVVALGDAHLGRQYYSLATPEGANQREHDFEESFESAVDLALSLEPDVVLWLGDVFDHPRPGYRAYRVAQRAMGKIRAHGAPLVAISGNHDTPRLPGTGSPYAPLADTFPEFHLAYDGTYRAFDLPGVRVHAVPQMLTVDESLAGLGGRPLVTPDAVPAAGLSPAELEAAVIERAADVPDGAVARLYVDGADPQAWRLIDHSRVAEAYRHALWFRLEPAFLDAASRVTDLPSRDAIGDRWARFLSRQDLTGYDPEKLLSLGDDLIRAAIDEAS